MVALLNRSIFRNSSNAKPKTIRIYIGLFAVIALTIPGFAVTMIAHDTTWGPDTVTVDSIMQVNNGVTLTIAGGSHLVFNSTTYLQVMGRLLAQGTASDSITFSARPGASNSWNGIRFIKTPQTNDTSKLSFCRIDRAGPSMFLPGAIAIDSFSKVIVAHSTIVNNGGSMGLFHGGGFYICNANPVIANCSILYNRADGSMSNGGGVYCLNADPVIVNTLLFGNSSSGASSGGGAVYCNNSNPLLVNCTVVRNSATGAATFGAAMYCQYRSRPKVVNTVFWGNKDDEIPVFDTSSAPQFRNCDIQAGSYVAAGSKAIYKKCMSLDPEFTDDSLGDCTLRQNSPCIDMGNADTTGLGLFSIDLADRPRIVGPRIDIGAYEFQGASYGPKVSLISPNGGEMWRPGANQNISWTATTGGSIVRRVISLSTNGGASFSKLDSQATPLASWMWTIPATVNSQNCLVGVLAYDDKGNAGWGVSDSQFTIAPLSRVAEGATETQTQGLRIAYSANAGRWTFDFGRQWTGTIRMVITDVSGRVVWRQSQRQGREGATRVSWRDRRNRSSPCVLMYACVADRIRASGIVPTTR